METPGNNFYFFFVFFVSLAKLTGNLANHHPVTSPWTVIRSWEIFSFVLQYAYFKFGLLNMSLCVSASSKTLISA